MAKSPAVATKSPVRTPTRKPRARVVGKVASKRCNLKHDDFSETHLITKGKFKGFRCSRVKGSDRTVAIEKNLRGNPVKQRREVEVSVKDIKELDHIDMLKITEENTIGDEDEDESLVEHEQKTWECPNCGSINLNESGYCTAVVDGQQCRRTPACSEILGWDGCFQNDCFTSKGKPNTWKCDECYVMNNDSAMRCQCCNGERKE